MNIVDKVLQLAVAIQQIPSPTFQEGDRADYVFNMFKEEGLSDIYKDEINNVYARLPGENSKKSVVISAHMDTVFPIETDLTIRHQTEKILGPGIGDNSLGVAGLFGLLWSLKSKNKMLPGDIWFVANVGEEGLGNLEGMRAVVKRFSNAPLAYVILEGMGLGTICHRGLGVKRYRISVNTHGGHSWEDYGNPSAIHELILFTQELLQINIPSDPRTSLNVGKIIGGTSINTIASEASLDLDLRSEQKYALDDLSSKVEKLVTQFNKKGIVFEAVTIGERPAGELLENHPLVKLTLDVVKKNYGNAYLDIGSSDANIPLSFGFPAVCIGLTLGDRAHTTDEFILTEPLNKGLTQLEKIVARIFLDL